MKRLYCLLIACMISVMLVAQTETVKKSRIQKRKIDYMESVSRVQINQYLPAEKLYNKGRRWFFRKKPGELAYLIASAEKGYAKAQNMLGYVYASKQAKELNFYDEEHVKSMDMEREARDAVDGVLQNEFSDFFIIDKDTVVIGDFD